MKKIAFVIGLIVAAALVYTSRIRMGESGSLPASSRIGKGVSCARVGRNLDNESVDYRGVNVEALLDLTEWIESQPDLPLLSLLISKEGRIVYKALTSGLSGAESHYVMSVTKSVTSALVGVAIDSGMLKGAGQTLTDILPPNYFPESFQRGQFSQVTLGHVLSMSALKAPIWPHDRSPEARARFKGWSTAPDRTRFALSQPLLNHVGDDFLYTDVTVSLASGALVHATHQAVSEFAAARLFGPMGFKNEEWMDEDASGVDNGAYGLRLRPIDMQKFGWLYLNKGCWNGQRLLSRAWIDESLTPRVTSGKNVYGPDYGYYWWYDVWSSGLVSHGAIGWKGQRIEVFPEQDMVVTMTALVSDGSEQGLFATIINRFVSRLSREQEKTADPRLIGILENKLRALNEAPSRIPTSTESRSIPSARSKHQHRALSVGP